MGRDEDRPDDLWPDKGIDTGPVLLQREVEIGPDDTVGSLYFNKLYPLGVEAMVEAVRLVREGKAPSIAQNEWEATYERPCRDEESRIDWSRPAGETYNLIRGCNPQPGAWTTRENQVLRIFECERLEAIDGGAKAGEVLAIGEQGVDVALPRAMLRLKRVQPHDAGKIAAQQYAADTELKVGIGWGRRRGGVSPSALSVLVWRLVELAVRIGTTLRRGLPLLCAFLLPALGHPGGAGAFGLYSPGSVGFDIAYPECESAFPPAPQAFALIGINGGRDFYQNPCLAIEYDWARTAPAPPSFYMNVNAPVGRAAFEARAGPKGDCALGDDLCLSYNFGYGAARLAFADAASQEASASMWWLDVETTNSWSDNLAANARVIQGAVDFLQAQGADAGIYSTADQWQQIAGTFAPGLPVWVAGAADATDAATYCAPAYGFGGGSVWLVQYPAGDFDGDYACPNELAPAPPAAPIGLHVQALGPDTTLVTWNSAPAGATGLLLNDGQANLPLGAGATSQAISGLEPGSFPCFALAAVSQAGLSRWTPWSCIRLPSG